MGVGRQLLQLEPGLGAPVAVFLLSRRKLEGGQGKYWTGTAPGLVWPGGVVRLQAQRPP